MSNDFKALWSEAWLFAFDTRGIVSESVNGSNVLMETAVLKFGELVVLECTKAAANSPIAKTEQFADATIKQANKHVLTYFGIKHE